MEFVVGIVIALVGLFYTVKFYNRNKPNIKFSMIIKGNCYEYRSKAIPSYVMTGVNSSDVDIAIRECWVRFFSGKPSKIKGYIERPVHQGGRWHPVKLGEFFTGAVKIEQCPQIYSKCQLCCRDVKGKLYHSVKAKTMGKLIEKLNEADTG